jgi:hypothetical protein
VASLATLGGFSFAMVIGWMSAMFGGTCRSDWCVTARRASIIMVLVFGCCLETISYLGSSSIFYSIIGIIIGAIAHSLCIHRKWQRRKIMST